MSAVSAAGVLATGAQSKYKVRRVDGGLPACMRCLAALTRHLRTDQPTKMRCSTRTAAMPALLAAVVLLLAVPPAQPLPLYFLGRSVQKAWPCDTVPVSMELDVQQAGTVRAPVSRPPHPPTHPHTLAADVACCILAHRRRPQAEPNRRPPHRVDRDKRHQGPRQERLPGRDDHHRGAWHACVPGSISVSAQLGSSMRR